jgi:hypothetical protein
MGATPPVASPQAPVARTPPPPLRERWRRLTPLARDVIVILFVKAALLGVLWFAFFRAPLAPQMVVDARHVDGHLLGASAAREPPHADR